MSVVFNKNVTAEYQSLIVNASDTDPIYSKPYYVHHSGSDSNTGWERQKPLASLQKLLDGETGIGTTSGQVIIVLEGHREKVNWTDGQINPTDDLTVVGEGAGTLRPYLYNEADVPLLNATSPAANVTFKNLQFGEAVERGDVVRPYAYHKITVGDNNTFEDCYFEFGQHDASYVYGNIIGTPAPLSGNAGSVRFKNCEFVSVSKTGQIPTMIGPNRHIGNDLGCLEFSDCLFDGGEYGLSGYGIELMNTPASMRSIRCDGLMVRNGVDFRLNNGTSFGYGYMHIIEGEGNTKIIW